MSGNWLSSMWTTEEGNDSNSTVEDNATISCAASNIDPIELPYPATMTTVRIIQSAYYYLLTFAALILNTLVIWLVAKFKKLRKTSLSILLQVVVLDLVLSLLLLSGLVTSITQHWLFGEMGCALSGFLTTFISLARSLLLGVFAINRFTAVLCKPSYYQKHRVRDAVCLSIASLVITALFSLAIMPGLLDCYRFVPSAKICLLSSTCSSSCLSATQGYGILIVAVVISSVLTLSIVYARERKGSNNQRKWKVTSSFFFLYLILTGSLLLHAAIGVPIFLLSSTDEASYIALVANGCLILLFIVADPILFMLEKDVMKVTSNMRKSLNNENRNYRSAVPPAMNTTEL
jgi:hypothetical protein